MTHVNIFRAHVNNIRTQVNNIRNFLIQHDLIDEFKYYEPPIKTGYVYDTSQMMLLIKNNITRKDKHSDSSFAICCNYLKKDLCEH
jgi:hypothetical protein